ncbi:hypothetical protein [Fodinicola feengrottensis]|uniref:hypothetical protein n=1 Tax=Fodinicola feengrottensis TaxID=435914 RepID=UPI002443190B|nr:hypothetical protein [Fodinicola feengrottensis]
MWPWSSRVQRTAQEVTPGGPAAPPASQPEPAPFRAAEAGDWQAMAPMGRTFSAHPLVNPVQRLTDNLTSWRDPTYLAPLGHSIDPGWPVRGHPGVPDPAAAAAHLAAGHAVGDARAEPAGGSSRRRFFTAIQRIFGGDATAPPRPTVARSVQTPADPVFADAPTASAGSTAPTVGASPQAMMPVLDQAPAQAAQPTSHPDLVLATPVQRAESLTTSTYQPPTRTLTVLPAPPTPRQWSREPSRTRELTCSAIRFRWRTTKISPKQPRTRPCRRLGTTPTPRRPTSRQRQRRPPVRPDRCRACRSYQRSSGPSTTTPRHPPGGA